MKKKNKAIPITDLMPLIILVLVAAIVGILTNGKVFSAANLSNILQQSVAYFIAALGMIFVVAMGCTDITCGSIIGLTGTLAVWAGAEWGLWAMFPVAIVIGGLIGLLSGVIVSKFKVPSFMVTLSLLLAIRAGVNWLLEGRTAYITRDMMVLDKFYVKIPVTVILILVFAYIFHYTPFGKYVHGIGENEMAMEHTGVNVTKVKIAAFVISAALAGVAGVFTVVRLGGSSNTMGGSMEMKVMLCMFLAGIPVEGGAGTKMYKMVIGVLTYFILDNGLTLLGGPTIINQIVRAVVLILALYSTRIVGEWSAKRSAQKIALEEKQEAA